MTHDDDLTTQSAKTRRLEWALRLACDMHPKGCSCGACHCRKDIDTELAPAPNTPPGVEFFSHGAGAVEVSTTTAPASDAQLVLSCVKFAASTHERLRLRYGNPAQADRVFHKLVMDYLRTLECTP